MAFRRESYLVAMDISNEGILSLKHKIVIFEDGVPIASRNFREVKKVPNSVTADHPAALAIMDKMLDSARSLRAMNRAKVDPATKNEAVLEVLNKPRGE